MTDTKMFLAGRVAKGLLLCDTAWPLRLTALIWQLPQVLVGMMLAMWRIGIGRVSRVEYFRGVIYVIEENCGDGFLRGMSLGCVVNVWLDGRVGDNFSHEVFYGLGGLLRHEYGHTVDSLRLGPLYLLVVGLPSLISVLLDGKWGHKHHNLYAERWADHHAQTLSYPQFQKNPKPPSSQS